MSLSPDRPEMRLATRLAFFTAGFTTAAWALLVVGKGLVPAAQGGLAYMLFAVATAAGRLTGDRVVGALGRRGCSSGAVR